MFGATPVSTNEYSEGFCGNMPICGIPKDPDTRVSKFQDASSMTRGFTDSVPYSHCSDGNVYLG